MRHLVISPGSRNAPLIRAFADSKVKCHSIVDERSAAFVALGMADLLGEPVGVLCTSGSALLNYGPAISEAYYLRVPLIVLSADRPARLIGHQDGQTIKQNELFKNIVKASFCLPEEPQNKAEMQLSADIIGRAFAAALMPDFGPVHINIPLDEPLYENQLAAGPVIPPQAPNHDAAGNKEQAAAAAAIAAKTWNQSSHRMIICGQGRRDSELHNLLTNLEDDKATVIIGENLSNLAGSGIVDRPDILLQPKSPDEKNLMEPDCIISFGGHLVSKQLKIFLRHCRNYTHYRIDPAGLGINTYHQLNREFVCEPKTFFRSFIPLTKKDKQSNYRKYWCIKQETKSKNAELEVLQTLFRKLPAGSDAYLGNSMTVRYVQMLPAREDIIYHGNRGVAGIDGSLSTAAGAAMVTGNMVFCCLGDLGFIYDSNGLWNRSLPANLRIAVLNNSGGDIFRRLKGPGSSPGFEDFFIANHPVNLKKLAEAYRIKYLSSNPGQIKDKASELFGKSDKAIVLEIKIGRGTNHV